MDEIERKIHISKLISQLPNEPTIDNFRYIMGKLLDQIELHPIDALETIEHIFAEGKYYTPSTNNIKYKNFRQEFDDTIELCTGSRLYALPAILMNILFYKHRGEVLYLQTLQSWWHIRKHNDQWLLMWDGNSQDDTILQDWIDTARVLVYNPMTEEYDKTILLIESLGERE